MDKCKGCGEEFDISKQGFQWGGDKQGLWSWCSDECSKPYLTGKSKIDILLNEKQELLERIRMIDLRINKLLEIYAIR